MTDDHMTRESYVGLRMALLDASRVASDLIDKAEAEQALLVRAEDFTFLTRRLQQLVHSCLEAEVLTRHTTTAERGSR